MLIRKKLFALFAAAMMSTPAALAEELPDVIRLGLVEDMTGLSAATSGLGAVVAARMAIEDYGGKVLGRPVELIEADNQRKPDVASAIVRQWLAQDFAAIIGGGSSAAALAITKPVQEADRTFVITTSTTSQLTNDACTPTSVQFTYDSYSLAKALVTPIVADPKNRSWFFITSDYAAGTAIQDSMTKFIKAAGGEVIGTTRPPQGETEYSSYLLQASSSKADVLGVVTFSADLANTLKQAGEFGMIGSSGKRMAIPLLFVNDVKAVGLERMPSVATALSFYWNQSDATREFTKRFAARMKGQVPEQTHAGTYTGVLHYLKALDAAGTLSGKAVVQKMKEIPVNDFYNSNVRVREDGRVLNSFNLVSLKDPSKVTDPNDVFEVVSVVPGDAAFQPISESTCPMLKK